MAKFEMDDNTLIVIVVLGGMALTAISIIFGK